jgi:Xaa-Pro dipeptidase
MGTSPTYSNRQQKLSELMNINGVKLVVLNPGPTLTYLTGLHFHLMERPTIALFSINQPPILILPELEAGKLIDLGFPIDSIQYGEDPDEWPVTVHSGLMDRIHPGVSAAIESTRIRFLEMDLLERAQLKPVFKNADKIISQLRVTKDADEIHLMGKAVEIAQIALTETLRMVTVGSSEKEIASELTLQLLRAGSDPEMPFSPIVATGPNTANPHAIPSPRKLAPGDLLLVDWGAAYGGYLSDLTRTFYCEYINKEFMSIAEIVKEANQQAQSEIHPGNQAGNVDKAARSVIDRAGYGPFFFHRTGHGLGMEAHEEPYIRSGSAVILHPGMTFTIEPGIYLPGKGGIRIEDNLVVTETSSQSLSSMSRDLLPLG